MKKLHLDSEYRDRWIEFHLADGTIEDSRLRNWRQVNWSQVIRIVAHLRKHTHIVKSTDPRFLTFMNFRWGGQEAMYGAGEYIGHRQIKIWTIGWTDGVQCFLKDIDFKTGQLIKDYTAPLSLFPGHIHPDIKDRI
ncbi:MAG: hypothetical protein BA863_12335 [Desulfovibrio sp. S3730MH75]|nr:MAG: hypothetical protein BA863_12335 [Desulfovibrio sp. S3730MH75]